MKISKEDIEKLEVLERGLRVAGIKYMEGRFVEKDRNPHLIDDFLDHLPEKRFVIEGEEEGIEHYVRVIFEDVKEDEEGEEESEVDEEVVDDEEESKEVSVEDEESDKPTKEEIENDFLKDDLKEIAEKEEGIDDSDLHYVDEYREAVKEFYGYE